MNIGTIHEAMIWEAGHINQFKFEEDFIEDNVRCIPMIVRFKLDACGIKLKLSEWSKFTVQERNVLVNKPCINEEDIAAYREYLQWLVLKITGMPATDLPVEEFPAWADLDNIYDKLLQKAGNLGVHITVQVWSSLTNLQRFALVKLSRQSHESKNLPVALKEFGLM